MPSINEAPSIDEITVSFTEQSVIISAILNELAVIGSSTTMFCPVLGSISHSSQSSASKAYIVTNPQSSAIEGIHSTVILPPSSSGVS